MQRLLLVVAIIAFLLISSLMLLKPGEERHTTYETSVIATGLDNPRGLTFGPDGNLYVAESGRGGDLAVPDDCEQVPEPIGPYTGGYTSRISKITPQGSRTTVVDQLPSAQVSAELGGDVSGVMDVAILDGELYAAVMGGCTHAFPDDPAAIIRVGADGSHELVADMSAFYRSHPVKTPYPPDFEPDGSLYGLAAADGALYQVEANNGALDKITPDGVVERVADISAQFGHIVPTAVAVGPDGNFYVGVLTSAPFPEGGAFVIQISPSGDMSIFADNLTMILGVAFDDNGHLYVLESSTGNLAESPFMVPGSGRIVRQLTHDTYELIADGFTFPTGMTFAPNGDIYVSNLGYGFGPEGGKGEIIRVDMTP